MNRTCIFCRKTKNQFSREHYIPDSLIGSTDAVTTLNGAVCIDCNSYFGRTVDADFLNHDLIRLIRLRNHLFLPPEKTPLLKEREAKQLTDQEGNLYSLDSVADVHGSRYEPSRKPNTQADRQKTVFVRSHREAYQLLEKLKEREGIEVTVEPMMPKRILQGPIDLRINSRLPLLNILYKMFLEFVYMEYGRKHCLEEKYDLIRKALLEKDVQLGDEYKWKLALHFPLDDLVTDKKGLETTSHTVGMQPDSDFWCFFFNMFGDATFYCTIPTATWYEVRRRRIDLKILPGNKK